MNKKIETYDDLLMEKRRLEALLAIQKEQVRMDIQEIKEDFKPVIETVQFIGKITSRDKSNPILNIGLDMTIGFLLKKVLSKAGLITKLAVPFFLKNYSSHIMAESKEGGLLSKLTSLFKKKKNHAGTDAVLNQ